MGDQVKPCPFCGSDHIKLDCLGSKGTVYKIYCEVCRGGTGWFSEEKYAYEAWDARVSVKALERDRIINEDLFMLGRMVFARNPETGNCYEQTLRGGKTRRISRKVFTDMYQACEIKIAKKLSQEA